MIAEPYFSQDGITLHHGDVMAMLAELPAESVSCVVTSPPFWGLRKYDCPPSIWGGSPDCDHRLEAGGMDGESYEGRRKWQHDPPAADQETPEAWVAATRALHTGTNAGKIALGNLGAFHNNVFVTDATCARCGAWRGWLGLEPTVAMYIEHTIEWLRSVRRVLRRDGVCWIDIDDSRGESGRGPIETASAKQASNTGSVVGGPWPKDKSVPAKNLCLIPQRIAIAAQDDGWIVRSEIIIPTWMPESAKDRPTDACRKVLMLCKSPRYWYDAQAVRIQAVSTGMRTTKDGDGSGELGVYGHFGQDSLRNLGSVWDDLPPSSSAAPGKHFATFSVEEPLRAILASAPAEVCRTCGKARVRIVKTKERQFKREPAHQPGNTPTKVDSTGWEPPEPVTVGWTSCVCGERDGYEAGLVLDPFVGTGTTAVAARMLGRRCVGIDASEEYLRQAVRRLQVGDAGVRKMIAAERNGAQQTTMFDGDVSK